MNFNIIRFTNYFLIIFIVLEIFILKDFIRPETGQNCNEPILKSNDFYTFSGFGIQVTTYNSDADTYLNIKNTSVDLFICKNALGIPGSIYPDRDTESILLLRSSQINHEPELKKLESLPYKNIIILCDDEFDDYNFSCNSENFVSKTAAENIEVDPDEHLNIGYIEKDNFRYFIFPESILNNVLRYPNLLSLISSISGSQHIENIGISNNIEMGKRNGISFFIGMILCVFLLNLIIIYTLNIINDKMNIKREIVLHAIPFISIIPSILIAWYVIAFIPYVKQDAEITINKMLGFDVNNNPNSFWILGALFLLLAGSELNSLLFKYKEKIHKLIFENLNINLIRAAIIVTLSFSLLQLTRNTEVDLPAIFSGSLIFGFLLYIIYIGLNPNIKSKTSYLNFGNKFSKYISADNQKNLLKIIYMVIIICLSGVVYYYSEAKSTSKNKIFFDPPKEYFTTPYSKLVRPYEVFHEYNVQTIDPLFIDDFIISHPKYTQISYLYNGVLPSNQSFGYLESEEENSIKPLLNDAVLNTLETKDPTSYFRFRQKNDLNSKIIFGIRLKCENEINSSIYLEKFRASYDKNDVIYGSNPIYTKRKCTTGEEYEVNIIMNLEDISTYAFTDEILKLSANNKILGVKITTEDPGTKIAFLDLKKEGDYIFHYSGNSGDLLVLSDKEMANNMKFIRKNNQINLGESVNLLKSRNLIPDVITIDSLNKYTLIKYSE